MNANDNTIAHALRAGGRAAGDGIEWAAALTETTPLRPVSVWGRDGWDLGRWPLGGWSPQGRSSTPCGSWRRMRRTRRSGGARALRPSPLGRFLSRLRETSERDAVWAP
jgi:hypothetical protein